LFEQIVTNNFFHVSPGLRTHQMSQENRTSKRHPIAVPLQHGITGSILQCKSWVLG